MSADRVAEPAEQAPARGDGEAVQAGASLLTVSTVVVSAANYLFSLVLIRLLAPSDFVRYVSVQSVLLVLGTGCMAAVPWAVAHHIATRPGRYAAGEALGFGFVASIVQGLVFAVVAVAVVAPTSGWSLAAASAMAAFALSVITAPIGLLQGWERLAQIAVLRLVEASVRIGTALLLVVLVARSPVSPVMGFILGNVVLLAWATWMCRTAFPLRRTTSSVLRAMLRRSLTLGGAQTLLALIAVVDTVVIGLAALDVRAASGYQVAALLGRVPLFLSAALAMGYYSGLAGAPSDELARGRMLVALRQFVRFAVPVAALLAGLPAWMARLLAPGAADPLTSVLPATATLGLTIGAVTVLTTWQQARGRFPTLFTVLLPIAAVQPVALIVAGRTWSLSGYAWCGVAIAVLTAIGVGRDVGARGLASLVPPTDLGLMALGCLGVAASHVSPGLWWTWWAGAAPLALVVLRGLRRGPAASPAAESAQWSYPA